MSRINWLRLALIVLVGVIIQVTIVSKLSLDALHPERARIFVLPNPRSRQGKVFYAEPLSAGVRLIFPLPSDS